MSGFLFGNYHMPISTNTLEKLFMAQHQTNELDLSYQNFELADIGFLVSQLSKHCMDIISLNLTGCHLNDRTFEPFCQLHRLQTLTVASNELTDHSVDLLINMPSLTTLNVNFNRISNHGASALAAKGHLAFLSLNGNHISSEGLIAFAQNSHLRCLSLTHNEIVDRDIEQLTHNESRDNCLQKLLLSHNYLHDQGLHFLSLFNHLVELNLSHNKLSSLAIDYLARHFHGTRLNIAHNYLGDQGAIKLAEISQLTELNSSHNQINYAGTAKLAQLPNLQILNLSYNHLNDEAIQALARNTHLTCLDISHNDISATSLQALSHNTTLKTLFLTDSQLTDHHIKALADNASLTQLDLTSNKIGNAGAKTLSDMPHLTSLRLNCNSVGNEGALALAKNQSLRFLYLDHNQIGDAGIAALAHNTTLQHSSLVFNTLSDSDNSSSLSTVSPSSSSSSFSSTSSSSVSSVKNPANIFLNEDIHQMLLWTKVLGCILTENGTIQFSNTHSLKLFGYTSEFISGKNIIDFTHPEDKLVLQKVLLNGVNKNITLRFLDSDAEFKTIHCNFQWSHKLIYVLGTDLSLQKKSEKTITHQIQKEIDQNKATISKQAEFIAHLCHELRNPLSGVISLVDIIYEHSQEMHKLYKNYLGEKLSEAQKNNCINLLTSKHNDIEKSLTDIRVCCHYQEEILNDNLDVTKILEGKIALNEQIIDIKEELQKVIHINQSKAAKKGLSLTLSCEKQDNYLVKGDAMRIKQIALNLVNNAIKFTEQGRVQVALVILDTTTEKTHFSLTVHDSGIGLEKNELDTLFGRYTQANLSIGSQYGGSGLGLYIARRLAQQMGGDLSVNSQVGMGSQFSCDFFCCNLSATERLTLTPLDNQASPMMAPSALKQAQTRSALVVEDNEINIKVLVFMLEKMGHTCRVAHNGLEAVQCYRDHHDQFDIIFMDTYMPKMTGLEAIASIRQFEQAGQLAHMPIITLSGNALDDDKALALRAGADDYMIKPFKKAELAKVITQWTSASRERRATSITNIDMGAIASDTSPRLQH